MPSNTPVVLILGAGVNIGANVANAFIARGYNVALASRTIKEDANHPNQLNIKGDLADPSSVRRIFETVKAKVGLPHVVIYNGNGPTPPPG